MTFAQAGKADEIRVGVSFKVVDRSQMTINLKAPNYKLSRTLWDGDGTGTKSWVTEFSPSTTPTLTALTGTVVDGDWVVTFSNAAVNLAVV